MANKSEKSRTSLSSLKSLVPFIKEYRLLTVGCLLVALVNLVVNLSEAWFVNNLVTSALGNNSDTLLKNIKKMLVVIVLGFGSTYLIKFLYGVFSTNIMKDIRLRLVRCVQNQPLSVMEGHHSGDLLSRVTGDVSVVQDFLNKDFLDFFMQILFFISATIYMITINWKLLLFSMMLTPPVLIFLGWMNKPVKENAKQAHAYLGKSVAVLEDTVGGIYMMKAFAIDHFLYNRYAENVKGTLNMWLRNIRISSWNMPLNIILRFVPRILCVSFGGYMAVQGELTPGELLSFSFLLGYVSWPLAFFPFTVTRLKSSMGAFERVLEVLEKPEERTDGDDFGHYSGDSILAFDHVSFAYNENQNVLSDLSFQLPRGKKIALVGSSGSGKSTIIKLICEFYKRDSGDISFYERSIDQWNLEAMRSQISLVSQDTYLFPLSIRENIACGKPDASLDEIIAASQIANAHSFISALKGGYDAMVGERGIKLSGGQRQRIAIARAVLNEAPVILLDEPTSALDNESEAIVQQALDRIMREKTVLIVAHRLSTIKNVDEILVMDNGQIVESGSHKKLIERDGVYCSLYKKQIGTDQSMPVEAGDAQ